jgi:hypothetical protein
MASTKQREDGSRLPGAQRGELSKTLKDSQSSCVPRQISLVRRLGVLQTLVAREPQDRKPDQRRIQGAKPLQ